MSLIVIPHLPGSLNKMLRGHWSVRSKEATRWRIYVWAHGGQRAAKLTGPVEVWITFYWPDRRRHDASNGVKLVLDAAVHHGLIPDDGPPWVLWEHCASRYDPVRPRTEFRYEPAECPAWPLLKQRARQRQPARAGVSSPPEAPRP